MKCFRRGHNNEIIPLAFMQMMFNYFNQNWGLKDSSAPPPQILCVSKLVQRLSSLLTGCFISNTLQLLVKYHMAATQCITVCRHVEDELLEFKPSIGMMVI